MEKFTFFWAGEFSQWYPSRFMKDGKIFNCAEQYMMYKKAELFNDAYVQNAVMNSNDPREQKKLGREIKGFDKDKWDAVCKQYVYDANYSKFVQNDNLYNILMQTLGTTLVEASPEDKIWGIGLHKSDERALNRVTWEGTNWLGEIITKVREDLILEMRGKAEPAPAPAAIGMTEEEVEEYRKKASTW